MEQIVAVLNRETTAASVLKAAGAIAARIGNARIDALIVRSSVDPSFMPTEEVMTEERSRNFDRESGARAAHLREAYRTWRESLADPETARLVEVVGDVPRVIAAEATRADLIVVSQGGGEHRNEERQALHTLLYDADAPVVVVPPAALSGLGAHPAVAWKRTDGAEKSINAALPILLSAERVTILVAREQGAEPVADPSSLLRVLERSGVRFDVVRFDCGDQEVGPALLSRAKAEGADLLVMGAFAHGRFVEMLTGGATEEILRAAEVPLLLHH